MSDSFGEQRHDATARGRPGDKFAKAALSTRRELSLARTPTPGGTAADRDGGVFGVTDE
jgi:hypothetical protein